MLVIQSKSIPIIGLLVLGTTMVSAQTKTSFHGVPSLKISESGLDRVVEKLSPPKSLTSACIIREVDGKYFWASRGDKPLTRVESGTFVIYVTFDGSGYVRAIATGHKSVASQMSDTESVFDYVEHLNLGLRSITYYGKFKQ